MISLRAAKLRLRDPFAAALARVPRGWLERARAAYLRARPGSAGHRALAALMRFVRYRAIDRAIDSFEVPGFAPAGRAELRLRNCASTIARSLYWLGAPGWEPSEVELWIRCCRRARHVLELGANIGYYTVAGASAAPDARYVAVEAHPRTAALLRDNLRLNGLSRVEVVEGAVVAEDGETSIELYVPRVDTDEAPAMAFVRGAGDPDFGTGDFVTVRCIPIGELIAGVDLLKLDIEGHELAVLAPIADQLAATRPTILIEVLDNMTALQEFLDALIRRAGYQAYALTGGGPVRLDRIAGRRLRRELGTRDLILTADPGLLDRA